MSSVILHPNCNLNCCRFARLQNEITFYKREAKLLRDNVEDRESLQNRNPALRPLGLDSAISQQDLKDDLFTLKLKARKMLAMMKILGRQVDHTQNFFELNSFRDGARNWVKEEEEWAGNEERIDELKRIFEEEAPRVIELQRTVWMKCYAVEWLPAAMSQKHPRRRREKL